MTTSTTAEDLLTELVDCKDRNRGLLDSMLEVIAILESELGEWLPVETPYLPDNLYMLKIALITLNEALPPEYNDD